MTGQGPFDERAHWSALYAHAGPSVGEPCPYMVEVLPLLGHRGRALEVAMGAGHTAVYLAGQGFEVVGIDIALEAVRRAIGLARGRGLSLTGIVADMKMSPLRPESLDLVCGFKYLERPLLADLVTALRPGGHLVWQTFTSLQRQKGWGPRSPAHILEPGELAGLVAGLSIVHHREADEGDRGHLAGIVARKPRP